MIRWQVYEDPEYEDYLEEDQGDWVEIEIQPVVKIQHTEEEDYSPYWGA
jgi:hypothetical protein